MKLHKSTQKYFWNSGGFLPVMGTGAAGSVQNDSTWVGAPTPALQKPLNDHVTFWIQRDNN